MDWLARMNGALDYIEDHLGGEIDYRALAAQAGRSPFHLQRMFPFITDITLSDYIRRRRLSMAAVALQDGERVLEVALRYGYESPESFSRAFRRLHGVPPSAIGSGVTVKCYPRLSFQITIKGEAAMNYRIEEKEPFAMHGVARRIDRTGGNNFKEIPRFWQECYRDGTMDRLARALGLPENATLHAGLYDFSDTAFSYMIGGLGEGAAPNGYETLAAPAATWAIFTTDEHGEEEIVERIQTMTKRVFSEWFPSSGYEHAEAPEFEMYHCRGEGRFYSEVWVPVVKK